MISKTLNPVCYGIGYFAQLGLYSSNTNSNDVVASYNRYYDMLYGFFVDHDHEICASFEKQWDNTVYNALSLVQ